MQLNIKRNGNKEPPSNAGQQGTHEMYLGKTNGSARHTE
jgi:hypothetical protein